MNLLRQKCVPCEKKSVALTGEEIKKHLNELESWELLENKIFKRYNLTDFVSAIEFVNSIGHLAEEEGHHPDMHISYDKMTMELWTHAINGLTINDFIMAAKIDDLYTSTL